MFGVLIIDREGAACPLGNRDGTTACGSREQAERWAKNLMKARPDWDCKVLFVGAIVRKEERP